MLADRYRLGPRIASGGMGTVHEGRDERLGRRVAVKLLKEEYGEDAALVERFTREARAAASLGHPNIAQVYDVGVHDGRHYLVMELVAGKHLGQVLRERGPLEPAEAVDIAGQVCDALAAAHAAGIVHRDVKPGNVLVREDGQVKVTDFGIAQVQGQTALTQTGSVLGTAQYLSPEQATGGTVTPASDLYSLGILLFHMLSGSVPFTGDSPVAVALAHVTQDVPPLAERAPDVPAALAAVVARATAKEPAERYADAAAMGAALTASLAGPAAAAAAAGGATTPLTAVAPPVPPPDPPARAAGRTADGGAPQESRRGTVVLAVAAVVAVVLLGWWLLTLGDDQADPAGDPAPDPAPSSAAPDPEPAPTQEQPAPEEEPPTVPDDAVGMEAGELEDLLREAGLEPETGQIPGSEPEDEVIATIPAPGTELQEGDPVVVVASTGEPLEDPAEGSVPDDAVGRDRKDLEKELKDAGFEVEVVDVDSDAEKDTVVATYPDPGRPADDGAVVIVAAK